MSFEEIYTVLLDQPRQIDGKTWHGFSYQIIRDDSGKIEVREIGWPTKLTLWETDGPELDALDEATVKGMIEAALPVDADYVIPPPPVPHIPTFTAEQHLESNGFGSLRLVALLDLEAKLAAAQKSSAAMSAARAWIDGILAAYATDPSPRSDWPLPPVSFEQAVASAMSALQQ